MRYRFMSTRRLVFLLSLCPCLISAEPKDKNDLATLVVVGDSLAAGFQNFSLVHPQQVHSFANLIAIQARTKMTLPLVPCPGIPNLLQLSPLPLTFPPNIAPFPGDTVSPFSPRENPAEQATNLAVPGQTVSDALYKLPSLSPPATAIDGLTDVVLGFPAFLQQSPVLRSQVDTAVALQPTTVLVWLGANDALFALLYGDFSQYTPLPAFIGSYTGVMQSLLKTGANLFTANIPDITAAPFFTPAPLAAAQFQIPLGTGALADVGPGDYLRPGALAVIAAMQANHTSGPLPPTCPLSIPGLPATLAPCVLTAADAAIGRQVVNTFNAVIEVESYIFGAKMVDIHALAERLHTNGYDLKNGQHLSMGFLGGLVSLDGVHPTNTTHALFANEFIAVMNEELHTQIPAVSVDRVAHADPLLSPFAASAADVCPQSPPI